VRAITTPLLIVVVAIVLLITAVVIIVIFSGGMQNVVAVINSWFGGGDPCLVACNGWKATCKAGESIPYSKLPGCPEEKAGGRTCVCQ
jgi:autotransporter translocation and assembly factor TamB